MSTKRRLTVFQVLWIYFAPLILPWVILFGANAAYGVPLLRSSLPRVERSAQHCNWDCHNHACSHRPKLPAVITDDQHVFGYTIRGLYLLGRLFSSNRFEGYGIATLVVFCLLWPALMYALWIRAWTQRLELIGLRALRKLPEKVGS